MSKPLEILDLSEYEKIKVIRAQQIQINELKAISELAVKGLKEIMLIAPMESESFTLDSKTLWKMKDVSEIERLQNG